MQEQLGLVDMIQRLLEIDDETWGLYAFSKEPLQDYISPDKKIAMIIKAMDCGKEYARNITNKLDCRDVHTIAEKCNLNIEYGEQHIVGNRILFACFTPPRKIEIMYEPVLQAKQLICKNSKSNSILIELFDKDSIIDTILGHEIFHYIEEEFEQEIYTRTEKVLLWNFLGFKNYSNIRALSEISAMAFTKELNGLSYSPFLLDVLLSFGYNFTNAVKIYNDVLGISSGRCRETVEDK